MKRVETETLKLYENHPSFTSWPGRHHSISLRVNLSLIIKKAVGQSPLITPIRTKTSLLLVFPSPNAGQYSRDLLGRDLYFQRSHIGVPLRRQDLVYEFIEAMIAEKFLGIYDSIAASVANFD